MSNHQPPLGGATDTTACSQLKSEDLQCQDALRKCEHSQHPYLRLYQYLQQQPPQQRPSAQKASPQPKPKRGGATAGVGVGVDGAPSQSESAPPIRGLCEGGGSSTFKPTTDGSSASSSLLAPSPSMRHSSPAPPPPSPVSHRGCAPPPPVCLHTGVKPLPPKPPHSPLSTRCLSTSGRSAAPPLTPAHLSPRVTGDGGVVGGGESCPEMQQRQNSISTKRPAPSPGGHAPTRYPAPPPPSSSSSCKGPPPPVRDSTTHISVQSTMLVAGGREAPPPPPCKTQVSPSLSSDQPIRGKPSAAPTRTPSAPPPPPPRNGLASSPRLFLDDFESRYSFHPLDDFPPPDEFKHFTRIYPSRINRVTRGAPPLPPVGR